MYSIVDLFQDPFTTHGRPFAASPESHHLEITARVVATGRSYAAVVGTDPTDDVAVLRLSGAAGLATARLATPVQVAVGDAVTAVGNAGGQGGTPTAASGSVVALARDITASDQNGTDAERLTGLIEVNAVVRAGDSGVVRGAPAAAAGLRAGNTIITVDGVAVDHPDALSAAPAGHRPRDRLTLTWTDTAGASRSATITLAAGPA